MKTFFTSGVWLLLSLILTSSGVSYAASQWQSDVPLVSEALLNPQSWLETTDNPQRLLMSQQQIQSYNAKLMQQNPLVTDPLSMGPDYDKQALIGLIESISSRPSSDRFYPDGRKLTDADWQRYRDMLNLEAVKSRNSVQYAMVVRRSSMRTFPTRDRVLNKYMDADLDRFQETGAFPGQAAAVLHYSKDKQWALVQVYNYLAWMPVTDFAIGSKAQISQFLASQDRLVITGDKVWTNYVPGQPDISEVQLDMSVSLPLMPAEQVGPEIYGQNPFASYVVNLPVRQQDGSLDFKPALIGRNQDVHRGLLPFTRENIVRQAFKFLGERYGWGHDYNGRDCTGFVGEVYRTFGMLMPRNSGDQGAAQNGDNRRFARDTDSADKMPVVKAMDVGDLIYIPGHVMMYLGEHNGQPFVIHDVKGLAYTTEKGEFYRGTLNGVSVTPLLPLRLSESQSYLDRVYNIKSLY